MPGDWQNVAIIRKFLNAFNNHDLDKAMSHVAPLALLVTMGGTRIKGPKKIQEALARYFKDAPKAHSQ